MTAPRATVIVVNYEGRGRLGACLDGLRGQSERSFEVIVIDNASSDGSWDEAEGREEVTLVRNYDNVGFGRACNQGAELARGDVLAFLNFDSVPEPEWLGSLLAVLDSASDIGAVQGLVICADGSVNTAGNRLHFLGFSWAPRDPVAGDPAGSEIAVASGASCALRRDVFLGLGGFWPAFFLYCEDTDLSWRVRLAGLRIVACPAARSIHDYEFGRHDSKMFHLERNRLMMVLANYERSTLLRLAPAFFASELALLGVATAQGWGGRKLAAWVAVAAERDEISRQRRHVAALRRVGDERLAPLIDTELGPEFGAFAARASAPVLALYARLLRIPARRRRGLPYPS